MIDSSAYVILGAILLFSLVFTFVVIYKNEGRILTYSLLRLGYELRKTSQALSAFLFALAIVNTVFLLFAQADPTHHILLAIIWTDSIFFPVLVAGYRRRFLLKKRIRTLQLELQEQASKVQQEAPVPPSSFASPATKSEEAAARCPSCGTSLVADAVCPTCHPFASESMGTASMSSDEESNPYEEHLPFVENLAANSRNQLSPAPREAQQETDEKQKRIEEMMQRYGQLYPEQSRPPRRSASALLLSALICIFYASSNWWSTLQSTDPLSASKLTLLAGWCVLILFACGFIAFTLITMRSRDL
jgi:uncharacterized Zn finger protein (UPF0148 family)